MLRRDQLMLEVAALAREAIELAVVRNECDAELLGSGGIEMELACQHLIARWCIGTSDERKREDGDCEERPHTEMIPHRALGLSAFRRTSLVRTARSRCPRPARAPSA